MIKVNWKYYSYEEIDNNLYEVCSYREDGSFDDYEFRVNLKNWENIEDYIKNYFSNK